jgi:hypothetical protein
MWTYMCILISVLVGTFTCTGCGSLLVVLSLSIREVASSSSACTGRVKPKMYKMKWLRYQRVIALSPIARHSEMRITGLSFEAVTSNENSRQIHVAEKLLMRLKIKTSMYVLLRT